MEQKERREEKRQAQTVPTDLGRKAKNSTEVPMPTLTIPHIQQSTKGSIHLIGFLPLFFMAD